jgi:hypothetical protein
MSSVTSMLRQVRAADSLPALLAGARQAFEAMLAEIQAWQDPGSALFTVYVMAAGYAADGLDAITAAPSLPPPAPAPPPALPADAPPLTAAAAARSIVSLSRELAARLDPAGTAAPVPGDRDACAEAAGSARIVADLLGGALT